jgi:hypothetical protein
MIFGGVGDANTTKNHYMNTTISIRFKLSQIISVYLLPALGSLG